MNRNLLNIFLTILLFTYGCDAPRNNILDPAAGVQDIPAVSGRVFKLNPARDPVPGVLIKNKSGTLSTLSSTDGSFSITVLNERPSILYLEKPGFHPDSVLIDWGNSKNVNFEVSLNSIPEAFNTRFFSSVTNRFPDLVSYRFSFETEILDIEGDLDSIVVYSDEFDFNRRLEFNPGTRKYEISFGLFDIAGIDNPAAIIAKDFFLISYENTGKATITGVSSIKRIITTEPRLVSPANAIETPSQPEFVWLNYDPGFNPEYSIGIFTDDIQPEPVLNFQIPKGTTTSSFKLNSNLPPGSYFWVLFCKDEFNNSVRSKPASFRVRN
ncbi:MAG: carboxypeptidase regulatory-like domain-containing protein [Ignavibacteriaceae bacterium]|nr:carboxypeptidase regulatory-like domain-containing protein [Ignavibacteriaceae bacterium]